MSESMYLLMFFGMIVLWVCVVMLFKGKTPARVWKEGLQLIQEYSDDIARRCRVCKIQGEKSTMQRGKLVGTRRTGGKDPTTVHVCRYICPGCGHRKLFEEEQSLFRLLFDLMGGDR